MLRASLVSVVICVAAAAASAQTHTWTVGDIAAGTNIENILSISSTPNWTNSHIEVTLTSGSMIHMGANVGAHYAAMGIVMEDTGCYPASASIPSHTETATSLVSDWGVAGGLDTLDPAYVVTLTPDAVGTWLVKSWNLNGDTVTDSGTIVNGTIPEPTTLALLSVGVVGLIRRRRRAA